MREQFASYLCDPVTHDPLALTVLERDNSHILSGLLTAGASWYPIIRGVPRILIDELKQDLLVQHKGFLQTYRSNLPQAVITDWEAAIERNIGTGNFFQHQKKTSESFAYEWKSIYRESEQEKNNFFHFVGPFITAENLHGKMVLDAGCGSGRFTKQASLAGASVTFGTDLGESIEVAYQLTKDLESVCIVQADIYAMPFQNIFDVVLSIGVLHHLPKPQKGFSRLPLLLRPNGRMVIWIYNRRHNNRALYLYEPLRAALRPVPRSLLYTLCYVPAAIVQGFNGVSRMLESLGFSKMAKKILFSYYSDFPFNMKLNDTFDVLATPKSNYYLVEEIESWYQEAGLKGIRSYEHPEAGITCLGVHEAN